MSESSNSTTLRIAAIGDLHLSGSANEAAWLRELFRTATRSADVLAVCGDFTCHGRPEELRSLFEASSELNIPALAVLGNHDCESDRDDELVDLLADAGIDVLDGTSAVIQGIGFAGVKGFGGGFGGQMVEAFGERALKRFVEATHDEVLKLDDALRQLDTPTKVVLLHYAPIAQTLAGEPEAIWPFLGCSRLGTKIDSRRATVAFHGHAHLGTLEGMTPGGRPVFNVAAPVLRRTGTDLHVWQAVRDIPQPR